MMVVLELCARSAAAQAPACNLTTTWRVSTGSWFVDANWSDDAPTSSKNADINNGGKADINSAGAEACLLTLGFGQSESGNVSVAGGSLAVTNELEVGGHGKGSLTVTNGGTVSSGVLTIAALQNADSPSRGTVSVDGGTFTITGRCDVGGDNNNPGGIGLLTVTNGGTVTVTAGYLRVYTSGTLTGNGSISTTSETTVEGTISRTAGTITIGGILGLTSTAATQISVTSQDNPNQADISVSGTTSLNGRLLVTMTGTFTPGTQFTLLQSSGALSGFFGTGVSITQPPNQCFTPQVIYDYVGNHVYLYLDPCD
jgi:T5SS/PEP-CTERM-associated repeat protein